jgi:protein-tyrosine-phosphatase
MAFNILFICTGNTCRSPMAEAFLKERLPPHKKGAYEISSAGTRAMDGLLASESAVIVMKEKDIDLMAHKSRTLNENMMQKADLILALSDTHKEYVGRMYPDAAKKTFLLSEYADKNNPPHNITDPIGSDLAMYRKARDEIDRYIKMIAEKM